MRLARIDRGSGFVYSVGLQGDTPSKRGKTNSGFRMASERRFSGEHVDLVAARSSSRKLLINTVDQKRISIMYVVVVIVGPVRPAKAARAPDRLRNSDHPPK